MPVPTLPTGIFKHGTITKIEDRTIPRGAASRSLNWLTKGDHIEVRRGFRFLGDASQNTGVGKATGIRKVTDSLGVEHLWYTYGKIVKYFNRATEEFVELGTNLLGSDADGEDISLEEYVNEAGNQLWINSPNCAGIFKILIANPGSSADQFDSSLNFKGHMKIDTHAMFVWGRTNDETGVYRSFIDERNYTTVTNENIGTGNGSQKTFTDTLAFKASGAKRTSFGYTATDGTETFSDNYNGTLTGSAGGTGTINYTTGAISVTFNTAPGGAQAITASHQWEDSTNNGLADFGSSATRLAGEGASFRQDEGGGAIQNILSYDNVYYCMHLRKTWALTIAIDDEPDGTSNVPYRVKVGIPNLRAAVETGDGIYYIDDTSGNDVEFRLLSYSIQGSDKVVPISRSQNIDLNNFRFDQAVAFSWGDFVLFGCRDSRLPGTSNNRTWVYNRIWKSWDLLDYSPHCFEEYDGALVAGDALSDNVMELFSGFDDDDSEISNYWESDFDDLDIEGLKKSKKLLLQGAIGPDQKIKVSLSIDKGPFVEVGHTDDDDGHTYAIEGRGSYVDIGQSVDIGALTLGRGEVGGGGSGASAYNYERLFKIGVDKFDKVKIRYEAVGIGYASISTSTYWDIRFKGKRVPKKYRG